jgi:hypothetical protein
MTSPRHRCFHEVRLHHNNKSVPNRTANCTETKQAASTSGMDDI